MRSLSFFLCLGVTALCFGQYPGALDTTYRSGDAGSALGDGADRTVFSSLLRPDGRILIGGEFEHVNGGYQRMLGALNTDGTLDTTFLPTDLPSNWQPKGVYRMALQPDGMLLVAGRFNRCVHRMLVSGEVDSTFITGLGFEGATQPEALALALQPDGKILVGGRFTSFNGSPVINLARLNANGTLDATFQVGNGLNGEVLDMVVQPDGKIVVVGRFTNCWGSVGHIVRLNANGTLDGAFQASPGADYEILDVHLRNDGTLLIAGPFYYADGVYAPNLCRLTSSGDHDPTFSVPAGVVNYTIRRVHEQTDQRVLVSVNYSAKRLLSDGSLDTTFQSPALNYQPSYGRAIEVMYDRPDGRVFIGGTFVSVNGKSANHFALLNADGSYDDTFNIAYGFNSPAFCASLLNDGSVIVTGMFNGFDGVPTNSLNTIFNSSTVRLTPSGVLDTVNFTPYGETVLRGAQAIQPDGKILTGSFRITRLNPDGSLDASFPNGPLAGNNLINDIKVQPDGKILLSGNLQGFAGISSPGIVRLNNDGTVDGSFVVGTGFPYTAGSQRMALQPDGRIVVTGKFTEYNGTPMNRICRLMPDGALDTSFHIGTGFNHNGYDVEVLPDGRVLVAGYFSSYNGFNSTALVLLHDDGSVDSSFVSESTVFIGDGYMALTHDTIGKILLGVASLPGGLLRVNMDGTVDATFDIGTGSNGQLGEAIVQSDTTYLICGAFTAYDGTGRNRIARIHGGHSDKTTVQVKLLLGGAFAGFQMSSALLNQGLLPLTEPYSGFGYPHIGGGGELVNVWPGNPMVITDWVVVELRDEVNPSIVVATQSALLRRDGQVLSTRFLKNLVFDVPHGDYFVAVHHRNHLGVMTAAALALDDMPTHVDFTQPGTPTYGTSAQRIDGARALLWEGDATGNGQLKYAGVNNDRDAILLAIGGLNPLNTVVGYLPEDVNMDGIVRYVGLANDRDPILQNLPGQIPLATRTQQVP